MPNPNPKQENLKPFPRKGDRVMGKVIGTRYPLDVQEALDKMPSDDRQQLIRDAVENALIRKGLLSNDISPS